MNKKLRVGLLLDSYKVPAWVYKMLEIIVSSEYAEIVLVIKNQQDETPKPDPGIVQKVKENFSALFYILHRKFEERFFKVNPDPFAMKDLHELISVEEIAVTPIRKKFSDTIQQDDIEKIRKQDIDVFIRLGFRILRGDILKSSKYGIWSYHHGDNKVNRGMPAGVWEVLNGWDETGVILQVLTEDLDGGVVLDRSYSCTNDISYKKNIANFYWKALALLPRSLNRLHHLGEQTFFEEIDRNQNPQEFYYNRLFATPTNKEMWRSISAKYWNYFKSKVANYFYYDQWILLYSLNNKEDFSRSFFRYKKMIPPKDRFWADPHVVKKDNKYYIFIEELFYSNNKGHISVIEMDEKGNYTNPEIVLTKDYHLSYPFVFEDKGTTYMIPETSGNKTIELYKCVGFPHKWELAATLMNNVNAVDSTIFQHDGKYWLFTNIREHAGASTLDECFLFYSDSLLSNNWQPHLRNPIVSDVKQARPAGKLFVHNARIFRPAQNSAKRYGYGMQICEITTLTTTDYKEEIVQSIYPNWDKNILATHTINTAGKLTVIDGLYRRRK